MSKSQVIAPFTGLKRLSSSKTVLNSLHKTKRQKGLNPDQIGFSVMWYVMALFIPSLFPVEKRLVWYEYHYFVQMKMNIKFPSLTCVPTRKMAASQVCNDNNNVAVINVGRVLNRGIFMCTCQTCHDMANVISELDYQQHHLLQKKSFNLM